MPDRPPKTPNEWGILIVLSVFFGLFMVVELISEFRIEKLSVPFFLVSWVLLLILHEFGHALMARQLGWHVERICIGAGALRFERQLFGMSVEFRTIPLSGFVVPRPTTLEAPRLKQCLIYAAGPGIELLAVGVLVAIFGAEQLLTPSIEPLVIAVQAFCVAAILGAGFNLIPLPHHTEDGVVWSDGLGMILCWQISDESYRRMLDEAAPKEG